MTHFFRALDGSQYLFKLMNDLNESTESVVKVKFVFYLLTHLAHGVLVNSMRSGIAVNCDADTRSKVNAFRKLSQGWSKNSGSRQGIIQICRIKSDTQIHL